VFDFDLSADVYESLAREKSEKGDWLETAKYARKAIAKDKSLFSPYISLSQVFAESGEFELAANSIIEGLYRSGNYESSFANGLLANFFYALDFPDTAAFYAGLDYDELDDFFDKIGEDLEERPEIELMYPRGEEYYRAQIGKAIDIAETDVKEALSILKNVPDGLDCKEFAEQLRLIMLSALPDQNYAIELGEKLAAKYPDNSIMGCVLVSLYNDNGMPERAKEKLMPLLSKPDLGKDAVTNVLISCVRLDYPEGIIMRLGGTYRKLLEENRVGGREMLWLAQALYNVGDKEEAKKILVRLNAVYGEAFPAKYYLDLISENPPKVGYSLGYPSAAKKKFFKTGKEIIELDEKGLGEFEKVHNKECDNLDFYVNFFLSEVKDDEILNKILENIALRWGERGDRLLRDNLVSNSVDSQVKGLLLHCLLTRNAAAEEVEFCITTGGRFKHVDAKLPKTNEKLGSTLLCGYEFAFIDIVITDDAPDDFLSALAKIIDRLVYVDEKGKLAYREKRFEKLSRFRNVRVFGCVLLGYVYKDEETREEIIERYHLKPELYDKYWEVLFGGSENDGQ